MRSRHVSVVIKRSPGDVYAVAGDPGRLPEWATGLAVGAATVDGDHLVVDSPAGRVRVRFAARNELGVLDHEVTLPDGTTVYNPLRVLPHPDGAEVVFTLRQLTSDDDVDEDAATVKQDLDRLKHLLERPLPPHARADAPSVADAPPGAEPVFRLATAGDAATVGRMLHEFNTEFDSPTPSADRAAQRFEALLRRDDVLVVVANLPRAGSGTDGGNDAGDRDQDHAGFAFLTLRPTPYWDGPIAQLEELYVRPDLRAGGIGTTIITRAIAEVRTRGAREMHINVDSDDVDARRFYDRHGFSDSDPDSGSTMRCYLRQL